MVFLHGLGGTRASWGPQLRALGPRFRCVAWDMPGYGGSAPLEPLIFAGIADRVAALLDILEVDQADLVGLSFGGMHALHTALRHPQRVRRMVLADTSSAFGLDGTDPASWISARLDPLADGSTLADIAPAVVDAITAAAMPSDVRAEITAAFSQITPEAFKAAVHCLVTHDVRVRLAEISHPTRVIVGEHDAETPPSYAVALADGLANADLHVLAGVGHWSSAEAPEEFNRLVLDHLSADSLSAAADGHVPALAGGADPERADPERADSEGTDPEWADSGRPPR